MNIKDCPIKLPVSVNSNSQLIDANGKVVIPVITYRSDWQHVKHQERVILYICDLLNMVENAIKNTPLTKGGSSSTIGSTNEPIKS